MLPRTESYCTKLRGTSRIRSQAHHPRAEVFVVGEVPEKGFICKLQTKPWELPSHETSSASHNKASPTSCPHGTCHPIPQSNNKLSAIREANRIFLARIAQSFCSPTDLPLRCEHLSISLCSHPRDCQPHSHHGHVSFRSPKISTAGSTCRSTRLTFLITITPVVTQ